MGTAGGLFHFRDRLLSGDTDTLLVLNGDVCADFPLKDMLAFHAPETTLVTLMATEATRQQAVNYGCVVDNGGNTNAVLHYVEKPSSYISPWINCGVYVLSAAGVFAMLQEVYRKKQQSG